jgi:CelD/BcsL family acetyltransferase involved in cellulose biosynthesis
MTDLALSGLAGRRIGEPAVKEIAARHPFSTDVLLGADAYDGICEEWHALAALQSAPVLFQSPALLRSWARDFARSRSALPITIVVREDARAVLLWPLMVVRRPFFTIAVGAGAPIGQYDDILLDPACDGAAAWSAALAALTETVRPDVVCLERVRADGALRSVLGDRAPLSPPEGAPFADLSNGMRASRERDEAEAWLAEAMTLKRDWLRTTGRLSRAFVDARTARCLGELARTLTAAPDSSPRMIVSRLSLDGRTAAIEMGFADRGVYHLYLGAFAPEFAKLGPGNILTERVLEWCTGHGIQRYDMMAPRSRNKSEWQSGEVVVLDFALAMTRRGRAYAATVLKRLAPALRDAFYAFPARARTVIAGLALRMERGRPRTR